MVKDTKYTRKELYSLFVRFKAMCSMSPTPSGIDKETFRRAVPMLCVEDEYGYLQSAPPPPPHPCSGTTFSLFLPRLTA